MDDYLDPYLSSLSWSDANVKQRTSWVHSERDQPNVLLPNSLEDYQDEEKNLPAVSVVSLNHSTGSLAAQDTSSTLPSEESECLDKGLLSVEADQQIDCLNYCGNSLTGMMQYNTALHAPGTLNLSSPKQLPLVGDMRSSLSFPEIGTIVHNDVESSEFRRSLSDLQTLSPNPHLLWSSPSYGGFSSMSNLIVHSGLQSSPLQRRDVDDGNIDRYVEFDKLLQPEDLSASVTTKGKQEIETCHLSSLAVEPQTATTVGLPSMLQSVSATLNGGCNGIGKPRVRARRGQATDPHSIAERLRREKIAERMKNLQELVPNSNKTDKASMLDEIIEYVKFLQLQVKVLSMSRLGAAGAVVPLITDGQTEGSNGLLLSPLAGQEVDFSLSPDQIAFEQEVLKLMESDMTTAMQYLQSKGLCLMPIALATAISSGKPSPPGTASEDKMKFGFSRSLVHKSNSSSSGSNSSGSLSGIGTQHKSSDVNEKK
ncbi:hypothetical protein SLE2022_147360 [Rubroshorea leprosula]